MQPSDVSGFAQAAFDWLLNKGALPTLSVVALLIWATLRTGSTHLITMRLWQLVIGKRKQGSNRLGSYLDERDEVMLFRLQTGMRTVGTSKQVAKLISWLEDKDVDVDLVRACGDNFDARKPGLKDALPTPTKRLLATIASALFFYAVLIQGVALVVTPALVQVVKSARWYGVSEDNTFHFQLGASAPRFASSECMDRKALAARTKYPPEDVDVLCDLLGSNKHQEFLHNARATQSIPLVIGIVAALSFIALFVVYLRQAGAAIRLRKELDGQDPA